MNEKIISLFYDIFDSQKILEKNFYNFADDILKNFSRNEMHVVDLIKKIKNPNVTKLASSLNITRGGASKIVKKLLAKNIITAYYDKKNKKEIYYNLTLEGEKVFTAHEKIHALCCCSDLEYFNRYSENKLKEIAEFLKNYNKHLELRIKNMKQEQNNA